MQVKVRDWCTLRLIFHLLLKMSFIKAECYKQDNKNVFQWEKLSANPCHNGINIFQLMPQIYVCLCLYIFQLMPWMWVWVCKRMCAYTFACSSTLYSRLQILNQNLLHGYLNNPSFLSDQNTNFYDFFLPLPIEHSQNSFALLILLMYPLKN